MGGSTQRGSRHKWKPWVSRRPFCRGDRPHDDLDVPVLYSKEAIHTTFRCCPTLNVNGVSFKTCWKTRSRKTRKASKRGNNACRELCERLHYTWKLIEHEAKYIVRRTVPRSVLMLASMVVSMWRRAASDWTAQAGQPSLATDLLGRSAGP